MGRDSQDPSARTGGRYIPGGQPDRRDDQSPDRRSGTLRPRASMSRGGSSDTPPGEHSARDYSGPGPASRPPNGSKGGFGGGGLIRPPLASGGADDDPRPSGPRSAASRTPGRGGARPGNGDTPDDFDYSGRQPVSQRPRRPSDPSDSGPQSGRYGRTDRGSITEEELAQRRSGPQTGVSRGNRTIGERFRDAARSMSRQLSSVVDVAGRAGRSMRREITDMSRSFAGPPSVTPPVVSPGDLTVGPYRRSRSRLLARKWRLRRVRPNPIGYAVAFMLVVLVASALVGTLGAGGAYAVSYYQANRGAIARAAIEGSAQSTQIFDRNGTLLYALQGDAGQQFNIPYGHISDLVKTATVDTEDRSFWNNTGIDVNRTISAVLVDLSHGGAATQGASTITQQLVKRLVLHDSDKNVNRKISEAILSIGITSTGEFSKQQILQMYLNNIFYGDQNTGIEAAARNYFGLQPIEDANHNIIKEANEQLSLAQVAILVRLPNEPTNLQPNIYSCDAAPCEESKWTDAGHEQVVYDGARVVLDSMLAVGDVIHTQAEEDSVLKQVHDMLVQQQIGSGLGLGNTNTHSDVKKLAPNFVDYVISQLISDFGFPDQQSIAAAGLNIYTTLDYPLEKFIEDDANKYINGDPNDPNHNLTRYWYCPNYYHNSCVEPALKNSDNVHDAAAVALDPYTGDILAMMGGVHYGDQTDKKVGGFLNWTTLPRSMGSSTKPLVYATAFQKGWYPGIMMQDIPLCFPDATGATPPPNAPKDWKPPADAATPACNGQWYTPHNYDATSFSGTAPIRVMLANSLNIPATEAMSFVGDNYSVSDDFISMISRMGVHTCVDCANMVSSARLGPTTALGTQEMPLIDLTTAYGVFAAGGQHVPPRGILRIDNTDGSTAWTAPTPRLEQVMSPQVAYMITSILTDNQARAGDFKIENPLCFTCYPDGYVDGLPALNFGTSDNNTQYIAAKTGTSQGDTGPLDIVTMGYSAEMVMGVWAGNSDPNDALNQGIIGITGAGYIFHDAMAWAIKHYNWPAKPFAIPPQMDRGQFNCSTGLAPYQGTDPTKFATAQPDQPGNGWCTLANNTNSTDLYVGYVGGRHWPNVDWFIKGQAPDVS